jgi:hypothetical protein
MSQRILKYHVEIPTNTASDWTTQRLAVTR